MKKKTPSMVMRAIRVRAADIHHKPVRFAWFAFLAVLVGIAGGLGAVGFRWLISVLHNLLFLGQLTSTYNANTHTPPGPWGAFIILVPVIGALGVALLVTKLAPEAKGHGVPEVMDSIYYNRGIIRPIVGLVKSFASALCIGSGGSVGREGPIIQIGSSFGSTLGQIIPMPAWQRITLVAAGTGGGISATFNTPLGGILFATEIMLHEISVRTLVPVGLATATATYIGQFFFGVFPAFNIPALETRFFQLADPLVLLGYAGLGILMGAASAIYIHSIYAMEDFFEEHVSANYYIRHSIGMLSIGVTMYLLMLTLGHYYIEGVGYAAIQDVLTGDLSTPSLLLLLFLLKLISTSVTLGSGASGGIFSPALFMGATLGGAYGVLLKSLWPALSIGPPAFALAGMASVVGGATGAAIASIVMIFEMTLDYNVVLPVTIAVALSYGTRSLLSTETIYTLKLARRGHFMPKALLSNFHYLRQAKDIMIQGIPMLPASTTLSEFAKTVLIQPDVSHFAVEEQGRILGVVKREDALKGMGETDGVTLGEIAARHASVDERSTFLEILGEMAKSGASFALVFSREDGRESGRVVGLITKERMADALEDAVHLY